MCWVLWLEFFLNRMPYRITDRWDTKIWPSHSNCVNRWIPRVAISSFSAGSEMVIISGNHAKNHTDCPRFLHIFNIFLFFFFLAFASMAMVNYPYPAEFLAPLPAWPVKAACGLITNSTNGALAGLAAAASLFYDVSLLLINFSSLFTRFLITVLFLPTEYAKMLRHLVRVCRLRRPDRVWNRQRRDCMGFSGLYVKLQSSVFSNPFSPGLFLQLFFSTSLFPTLFFWTLFSNSFFPTPFFWPFFLTLFSEPFFLQFFSPTLFLQLFFSNFFSPTFFLQFFFSDWNLFLNLICDRVSSLNLFCVDVSGMDSELFCCVRHSNDVVRRDVRRKRRHVPVLAVDEGDAEGVLWQALSHSAARFGTSDGVLGRGFAIGHQHHLLERPARPLARWRHTEGPFSVWIFLHE